ncbi:MAG: hypothetical protein ACXAAH_02730 [Promethearchaeota archaeon]|jgi:hypothetical protein
MEEMSSTLTREYNKTQKIVAGIFYIMIVIASIVSLGGIVWTFADIFIGTTGKFGLFLELNLGYQIAIIGGLLAGLFFLIVFFFGLFKKTSRSLMVFIYKKRELEEKYKNRTGVKIAAGGLLISVIGIILGFVLGPIWDLLTGSGTSGSLFTFLGSTGPWVLLVGIGIFLIILAALFMIYFWKNGYYLILRLLGGLEKEDK